ncbi:hemoglobin subunit epsilon-like [Protopterus annectens]|uniref:hemoglobin subunit epsilon-like n=1 Tax=Protopterus annectens TaxID=7888 RepID=UPI001CFAEBC1|nr:hemoglobin subunit epsilon-like [Protopterus annectens]
MVLWDAAERKVIASVWAKVDIEADGFQALLRTLHVYPWTKRYFSHFGAMSTLKDIESNPKVRAHGKKVMAAVGDAINHIDNIKGHLSQLSQLHSDKLHVDPANFELLGNNIVIVLAAKLGAGEFTPEVQATFQKLVAVISSALSRQYH